MANTTLIPQQAQIRFTGKEKGPGWGSIGGDHTYLQRNGVPIIHWYPVGGIRGPAVVPTILMVPLFNRVTSPVAVPESYACECYTAGTFFFDTPVDAGQTYTCSVWLRKSAGYGERIQGFRRTVQDLLPYLEVMRSDGTLYRQTMLDVDESYQQLNVSVPVIERGILSGAVVMPGLPGASAFFHPNKAALVNLLVSKCWMNYYDVVAA